MSCSLESFLWHPDCATWDPVQSSLHIEEPLSSNVQYEVAGPPRRFVLYVLRI